MGYIAMACMYDRRERMTASSCPMQDDSATDAHAEDTQGKIGVRRGAPTLSIAIPPSPSGMKDMAHVVMAYIVMAYIVMAYMVMAYIVMATVPLRRSSSCTSAGAPERRRRRCRPQGRAGLAPTSRSTFRLDGAGCRGTDYSPAQNTLSDTITSNEGMRAAM